MTVLCAGDLVAQVEKQIFERLSEPKSDDGGPEADVAPTPGMLSGTGVTRLKLQEKALAKGERLVRSQTPEAAERLATLSLLLTWTPDLSLDDLGLLIHAKPQRIRAWTHGEAIPAAKWERLSFVARILSNLDKVLEREAAPKWLRTPVRDLGGRTPADLIRRNNLDPILTLTESYLDPSFG